MMGETLADEHHQLRNSVRAFLKAKSPEAEVRRLMDTADGYDPAVWSSMADSMGLVGLHIPEEYGGSGFSYRELGIVLEEMGQSLYGGPFFSSAVLAGNALLHSGDGDAKEQYLPDIARGELLATLAVSEPSARWDTDSVATRAERDGSGWALTGTKSFVIDGAIASLIIVAARTVDGLGLFAVNGDGVGMTRIPMATMDMTRKQATIVLERTPAQLLGSVGGGAENLTRTLDCAVIGLAAEQLGVAQRCLDMSVEYAKTRVQFGRKIGTYQAVKHKCSDMLVQVERARSAVVNALRAASDTSEDLSVAAAMAKVSCSEAASRVATETIQVHGGIGFTWEHPAHLYYRRACSSEQMFGRPAYHRELMLRSLGI